VEEVGKFHFSEKAGTLAQDRLDGWIIDHLLDESLIGRG
jgi:hypothetical protein